jgi:transposase-like protein
VEKISTLSIANRVTTEEEAYLYLEELRWGKGEDKKPVCPHCKHERAYFINSLVGRRRTGSKERAGTSGRRIWKCAACRKQFSVTTGTIFHGSHISLRVWLFVIFEMCSSKNGVAAREIERKYGVSAKSSWFMLHRIREAMKLEPLAGMLRGKIAADETYVGGKYRNMHADKRSTRPQKPIVLSLVDTETGEVRSRVIPNVTGHTLKHAVQTQVHRSSTLMTDEHPGYIEATRNLAGHETVNHSQGVYGRDGGKITTNHVEGYFSQLKRSIDGTHHHVSNVHLPMYLAEFDYRHTTRQLSDTYRPLKSHHTSAEDI